MAVAARAMTPIWPGCIWQPAQMLRSSLLSKNPGLEVSFMYGALADAGLKDVPKLDYVDRFTEAEAGSPVKDKQYYPSSSALRGG